MSTVPLTEEQKVAAHAVEDTAYVHLLAYAAKIDARSAQKAARTYANESEARLTALNDDEDVATYKDAEADYAAADIRYGAATKSVADADEKVHAAYEAWKAAIRELAKLAAA
jgi:hypothetical protein